MRRPAPGLVVPLLTLVQAIVVPPEYCGQQPAPSATSASVLSLQDLLQSKQFDQPDITAVTTEDVITLWPPPPDQASTSEGLRPGHPHIPFETQATLSLELDLPNPTTSRLSSRSQHESILTASAFTSIDPKFCPDGPATMASLIQKSLTKASETYHKVTSTNHTQVSTATEIPFSADIFAVPIDTKAPPSNITVREDHPVPRTGIASRGPLQTNKFYSNFFLGDQRAPTYTFPYSIAWAGGNGSTASWGMACSQFNASQRVFGNQTANGAASYFYNPVGVQSMVLSAKELEGNTTLNIDSMTAFSARVLLSKDDKTPPSITFPLVQGMAYVTAEYSGAMPVIQSGVFFKTVTKAKGATKKDMSKYTFTLEDGATWRLYAWNTKGPELDLRVTNNGFAASDRAFNGIIQIARDPGTPGSEARLDDGAGIFSPTLDLSGSAMDGHGTFKFRFQKEGHQTGDLYMYALPHHVESFDATTRSGVQPVQLQTTTKGIASLVKGSEWTMVEPNMPVAMDFAPWDPEKGSMRNLTERVKDQIRSAAAKELSQNMMAESNLNSMYFSGKALTKFALILYVANDMLEDQNLVKVGLGQLKTAFATFAANRQEHPLVYESAWGGVVSSNSYDTGDPGADFGNTFYNDHHFHYGYHILAGALIAHLDPEWLEANRDYVNTLVRDVANPSTKDRYFPTWRSFDWYHGHSWAHGLSASMDGKNQESSSEDMMHAYALKMWGKVTGDHNLEARGNLQLSILARSLQQYYLYTKDNQAQPPEFIGNKVAGILFENKIDHTTWFSPDIECIQGIHMLPILAPTTLIRNRSFVKEEWDNFFSNGRVDTINNGWKGILYANWAIIEPRKAFEFFARKDYQPHWIDGGASLTWSMAYAAALAQL